jgi:general secretion pathway protein E
MGRPMPMKTVSQAAPKDNAAAGLEVKQLLEQLVADAWLDRGEAKRVLAVSRLRDLRKIHPLVAIADQRPADARHPGRTLSLEFLVSWLAQRVGMPYERIDPLKINAGEVTGLISQSYAARRRILPLRVSDDYVVVATADPDASEWEYELRQMLRRDIHRVLANPLDIDRYIAEFFSLSRSVRQATRRGEVSGASLIQNLEQLVELGRAGKLESDDRHIVNIVDWLLQYAFDQRASDIHLEPRREQGEIRFRIDGILHRVYQVPPNVMNAIVGRIKTLGRMDIAEKRRPLDGRLKTRTPEGAEIELRLSTIPTALGEKMVLRIFDPEVLKRTHDELGLSDAELEMWKRFVSQPHGIVLVTGPTGSGKTTTLYSTLKQLATPEVNVCTVEEPIEMVEPSFNQIQVNPAIDLGFAAGVRSLLRQDPDIIMIGEVRDRETATVAIQAALTGHLVLSTLHTNDAPSAITRLMDIGVQPYLISATLLGVVAQRLVRTLCPHCKQPAPLDVKAWQTLAGSNAVPHPKIGQRAVGCDECRHTGYLGRTGLYEILTMRKELATVMQQPNVDAVSLRETALHQGMRSLRVSATDKVSSGITTIEEVLTVLSSA